MRITEGETSCRIENTSQESDYIILKMMPNYKGRYGGYAVCERSLVPVLFRCTLIVLSAVRWKVPKFWPLDIT